MYSVSGYGTMIADHIRTEAYARALQSVIRPDSVLADLGCGTGIFSLLACRFGARRVFAVEPDNAIQVAREAARANGFGDRIEFIQEISTRITLAEPADVVVSDMRGVLPFFQHHVPSVVDARARHLKPGGMLIPQRDTLWAAVVEVPEPYGKLVDPWADGKFELEMSAGRRIVLNTWNKARVKPEQLLTDPQCWATIDYRSVVSPNVEGAFTLDINRPGTAHGFLVWFDSVLMDGIGFSNSPHTPELVYGSGLFPWLEPVGVSPRDSVSITLRANLVGEDYIWRWDSCVRGADGTVRAEFQQTTFRGVPVVPRELRKRAADYSPVLNEEGKIDQFIFSLMGTGLTVNEIATRVWEQFPGRFRAPRDAMTRVGELSLKYSR